MKTELQVGTSRGFTLIEVLVAVIIIAIGLLGLAGLQMTSLNNQLEAYQRAQALLILDDMSNRIRANSTAARAGAYAVGDQYGLLEPTDCTDPGLSVAERDLCQWNLIVAGAAITLDGENIGSLMGARACVENIPGTADGEVIIRLTIAWQGMSATRAPAATCGQDAYGDDALRRTASVDTVLANLAL